MIKRILIIDYHSASNRGDAAILEGVITGLKKIFPNAKFEVITQYPLAAKLINGLIAHKNDIYPFPGFLTKKGIALLYLLLSASLFSRFGIKLPFFDKLIKKLQLHPFLYSDLVVSTGGSFLNDFYYPSNIARFWNIIFAKILGKKVIIYAQSIGPLTKKFLRILAKYTLSKVDCIILRDQKSFEILKSLSIKNKKLYVTADAAFSIPSFEKKPLSTYRIEELPNILEYPSSINISISIRIWSYFDDSNASKYIDVLTKLCNWLLREKNATLYFISTCTSFCGYPVDDRYVSYRIVSRLDPTHQERVYVLSCEYTPYELIHIYSKMKLHIGMRMHSCILALLANVPVIALAYEFKSQELMKMLSLEKYAFSIDSLDLDQLKVAVNSLLQEHDKIKKMIAENITILKEKSLYSSKIIQKILNDNKF